MFYQFMPLSIFLYASYTYFATYVSSTFFALCLIVPLCKNVTVHLSNFHNDSKTFNFTSTAEEVRYLEQPVAIPPAQA